MMLRWEGGMIEKMLFWGFASRLTDRWMDGHWCTLN